MPPPAASNTPPEADPVSHTYGCPGTPTIDVVRFPTGPMYRQRIASVLVCCACRRTTNASASSIAVAIRFNMMELVGRLNYWIAIPVSLHTWVHRGGFDVSR